MRRPAIALFGVALAACWTDRGAPQTTATTGRPLAPDPLAGAYWCSIDDGYRYPPFPCVIRHADGSRELELVKLGGSQRFRGSVRPSGRGFAFDGTFFCPFGDCTQELHGTFRPDARGFRGSFSDASFVVELVRAPGGGFGGASYGGDGYGGAMYGGAMYGGASYGNHAPSGRRNRRP